MDAAAWGLVGTLVGASASIGTTWLTTRSAQRLRTLSADQERLDRSNTFQRQTLLDLQEAIHDALRLTTRGHIEDREAHQSGSDWGRNMLGDEIDEGIRLAQRRVSILVERVADDSLRSQVKSLMSTATDVLLARSAVEARVRLKDCYSEATETLEGIGTVLRKHY